MQAMLRYFLKGIDSAASSQPPGGAVPPPRAPGRMEGTMLYVLLVAFCVVAALLWAYVSEIDRVVRVNGKIIAAGRSQSIQHLEGGIIGSIAVVEGAAVKKGDLLLTIDNVSAGANLEETKAKITTQKLRAARLESESRGSADFTLPEELANTPVGRAEEKLFASRREKLAQEMKVHAEAINQHTARLNEAKTRVVKLRGELGVAHNRSGLIEEMAARGSSSKLELLEARSREGRLETETNDAASSIPTLEAAIAEENARKKAIQSDFVTSAQTDYVAALAEIERLEKVLRGDSDRYRRTDIRSPIDGTVNRITVNTIGGVIRAGDKILELIPSTSEILIEAQALPKDRGYLAPGLDATVRLSAYDVGELGVLKGKVKEISADTIADARGEVFYRVSVLVSALPSSYQGLSMSPGMTATADIVTGKRTVLNLILSPVRKFTYSIFKDSI